MQAESINDKSETDIIETQTGQFLLKGHLLHGNAKDITEKGVGLIRNAKNEILIDLNQLQDINTVSVAVLLQWIRTAKASDISLRLQSPPKKLLNIIAFSDLEELFKHYLI